MLAAAAADIIKPINSITSRASQRILIVILSRPDAETLAGLSTWSLAYITMTVAPIRARL
jgi:hypothetical protein